MDKKNLRETGIFEMLGRIHVDIAVIQKDCEGIKQSLADTKKALDEKTKEDRERYAPKWIMIPLGVISTAFLVAIAGAIAGLFLVQPVKAIAYIYLNLFC